MTQDNTKAAIEALLFSSDRPLMLEQIKLSLEGLGTEEIRSIIQEMAKDFVAANRGLRIVEIAGGFQMITASEFAPFLKKLYKTKKVERLSRPALETLAIIAYKQPVTKADIQSLRSVNIDGIISNLLDKELIRITGRKKAPGRPCVYGTTKRFLEHFGLNSLSELPKMEDFSKLQPAEAEQGVQGKDIEQAKESTNGAQEAAQQNR